MTAPAQTYAGIGSRETPDPVRRLMYQIAKAMAQNGLTLRSGGADGADSAFERGCDDAGGAKEIFLPWPGFNGRDDVDHVSVFAGVCPTALALAEQHHPAWHRCKTFAKVLHARNGYQILGRDLMSPVAAVICWTPNGSGSGGTGQALRIARERGIPITDLGDPKTYDRVAPLFADS